MSSSVSPEPQPVVAIATGVAVTTMKEEVTVLSLLAGQPSTRQVQVRRSSLQPPGFELQTYWPVREGLNAPRHGTPQVVHMLVPDAPHPAPWTVASTAASSSQPARSQLYYTPNNQRALSMPGTPTRARTGCTARTAGRHRAH